MRFTDEQVFMTEHGKFQLQCEHQGKENADGWRRRWSSIIYLSADPVNRYG